MSILKIWIHLWIIWIYIQINTIWWWWWSGCSKYGYQGFSEWWCRLQLWRCCCCAAAASYWVSVAALAGCCERRMAVAPLETGGQTEPLRVTWARRLRWATASLRVTVGRGEWLQWRRTVGDGGPRGWRRAAPSDSGRGEWWRAAASRFGKRT